MTTADLIKANVINKKDFEEEKTFYLDILLKDYSDIRTKLFIFPNKNVTEERVKKQYYKIKDIKLIGLRLKLMIMLIKKLKDLNHYIFYFKYPKFSY